MFLHQRPAIALALTLITGLVVIPCEADGSEKQAVQNRRFSNDGKFEVALAFGTTPSPKLVRHETADLSFGWNFSRTCSIHLTGTYAFSGHTGAAKDAAEAIQSGDPSLRFKIADDFSDLWAMNWATTVSLRWMPFYGKISLFSAAVLRLGLWLKLGAGAGGFSKESLISPQLNENAIKPLFIGALGFRFYVTQFLSFDLAADLRAFPDNYNVSVDRMYPAKTGEEKKGITLISLATVSVVFSF